MSIFKACDIRGIYPAHLTEQDVFLIGRAIAALWKPQSMVVGGDVRLSTPSLKKALTDGLTKSGVNVIDVGLVPTPVFYYAKKFLDTDGGVMVTASHNPKEYNGLKIAFGKMPITPNDIKKLKELSVLQYFTDGCGIVEQFDIKAEYINHVCDITKNFSFGGLKVSVDCGNGCYSKIAPQVFDKIGIKYSALFCEYDGNFPNRNPDCSVSSHLKALKETVISAKSDLGIAFDGDGDRAAFVDENGKALSADQAIAIFAKYFTPTLTNNDKIVLDIKCSSSIKDSIKESGASVLSEKSGHTFIKTKMINENAVFGGEISGHFFYRELGGGDDGLYSALRMIDIVSRHGALSSIVNKLPSYAITPDIRIHVESPETIIDQIADSFPKHQISRLDGIKVELEDGWGLIRMSVTEPIITMRFEANNKCRLIEIIDSILSPYEQLRNKTISMLQK